MWSTLPPEIRDRILNRLAGDYGFTFRPKISLAKYASVSREWQVFFEKRSFHRLILEPSALLSFDHITRANKSIRLAYIRHLWLKIKLNRYDCPSCKTEEDETTIYRNNRIFSKAILKLLNTLARGNRFSCDSHGITLELSAHSPSDGEHVYRDVRLHDDYPFVIETDLAYMPTYLLYHAGKAIEHMNITDRFHGLQGLGFNRPESVGEKKRIRGTSSLALDFIGHRKPSNHSYGLPRVDLVKELCIRRQNYRNISVKSLAQLLLECFKTLRVFRHEQCMDVTAEIQEVYKQEFRKYLLPNLPPTLERLFFYERANSHIMCDAPVGKPGATLGTMLAEASQQLTHFSTTLHRQGAEFFWPFRPCQSGLRDITSQPYWPNLQFLALKCSVLRPRENEEYVNSLLSAAARAASRMPCLETMEIWYYSRKAAAIFRYSRKHHRSSITWRSTWKATAEKDLTFHTNTIQAWKETAKSHDSTLFTLKVERLLESARKLNYTRGRCLFPHLELKNLILDSVSLCHMQWDTRLFAFLH